MPTTAANGSAFTALLPGNPTRPPDWRWRRAGRLVEDGGRRRKWDDDWVARARRFRAALLRAGGNPGDPRLSGVDPPVLGAHRLRHGPQRRRWEAEARILAGQDDAAIGEELGIAPAAVSAYEALFFSARDRLDSSDWVTFVAIGPGLHTGFDASDVELLWKLFAFHGGPLVLDALIASPPDGSAGAPSDPRLAAQFGLLVSAMTLGVTQDNAPNVIALDRECRRIERDRAAEGVAAVTGPVAATLEVEIGPESAGVVHAECTPGGVGRALPGAGGGESGPRDAGEGQLRATA